MKKLLALLLLLSFSASAAPFGSSLLLSSGPSYVPNAWSFWNSGSGINYVQLPFGVSLPSGYTGAFSLWVKFDGGDGVYNTLIGDDNASDNALIVIRSAANILTVDVTDPLSGSQFAIVASTTLTGTGWHNILASWNTDAPAHSKTGQLYIDGINTSPTFDDTASAFQVNYSYLREESLPTFLRNEQISMSEVWIAPNQYLDFSQAGSRSLFYSGGSPVSLGSAGQIPTGTSPWTYLKNPAASVGTNSGTGGNASTVGIISSVVGP